MQLQFIDIDSLAVGISQKIEGYTGCSCIFSTGNVDGEDPNFAILLLIETGDGWEWMDIVECTKKGVPKREATLTPIDGGKKK